MLSSLSEQFKIRKSMLYLLVVVFFLASYVFFLKPEITYLYDKQEQRDLLERQFAMIEEKVKTVDLTKLNEAENRTQEFKKEVDMGLESQLVLLDAVHYCEKAGLDIISFSSSDSAELQDFKHRFYSISFKGNYGKFIEWLALMEQTPYYVNIQELTIDKYLITKGNIKTLRPIEEIVYEVTINIIALEGVIDWPPYEPEKFRDKPFNPGIVSR